ncbi:hypothetical protein SDJN02_24031, partial [Cucurbita argyrosperma subsp. argyrosperma]
MRSLALYILAFLCVATPNIEGNHLCFSSSDSDADSYKSFIQQLRQYFTINTSILYDIPILKHSVPPSQRFLTINLDNPYGEDIFVAVDVLTLRPVGYRSNDTSYVFFDAPRVAFETVFPSTCRVLLGFNSDFESIENAAATSRLDTLLGLAPFESAVSDLFHYRRDSVPTSFLVIIQMLLEATKFKFIEQSVVNSLKNGVPFKPTLAILSLQDNWAKLSLQIQASSSLQGLFGEPIELYDSNHRIIQVDSIYYPIIIANMALQLYQCNIGTNFIRMPSVGGDPCYVQTRTARISGLDGFCVEAQNKGWSDGNPVILSPCGEKLTQRWSFQSDGRIGYSGKCLSFNLSSYVVTYNCSEGAAGSIRWKVSVEGMISNPNSDLVLTANASRRSAMLTAEPNAKTLGQSWRVGNYVWPIVGSIIGLEETCLESMDNNAKVWLEKCVEKKAEQYWAVYSDGSIRVNSSRNFCVSAASDSPGGLITITNCNGSSKQRWVFMADATILNPKSGLVMEVEGSQVSRNKIILYPIKGRSSQQWTLFY